MGSLPRVGYGRRKAECAGRRSGGAEVGCGITDGTEWQCFGAWLQRGVVAMAAFPLWENHRGDFQLLSYVLDTGVGPGLGASHAIPSPAL